MINKPIDAIDDDEAGDIPSGDVIATGCCPHGYVQLFIIGNGNPLAWVSMSEVAVRALITSLENCLGRMPGKLN